MARPIPAGQTEDSVAREAYRHSFRPILMTTAAAMFGATLLLSGFVTKRGLGIAIIGGLVLSQMPTLETTPTLYLKFYELGARVLRRKQLQSWGRVT